MKNDLLINVAEKNMQNKQYNPQLYLAAFNKGYVIEQNGITYHYVDKKELKKAIKDVLHKTYYKCNVLIKTYIELGLITETEEFYIFNSVDKPFVGLTVDTVKFCLDYLNELPFKVYCYLMSKYVKHLYIRQKYHRNENYFFSKTEIALALGYTKQEKNILLIQRALAVLEDVGLIKFSESHQRKGHKGYYHELYWVKQYSSTQIKADSRFIKDSIKEGRELSEEVYEELVEPVKQEVKALTIQEKADRVKAGKGYFSFEAWDKDYQDAFVKFYGLEAYND